MSADARSWLTLGAKVVATAFVVGAFVGAGYGLATMWAAR